MKAFNKKSGKGYYASRAMEGLFAPQPDLLEVDPHALPTEFPEGPIKLLPG